MGYLTCSVSVAVKHILIIYKTTTASLHTVLNIRYKMLPLASLTISPMFALCSFTLRDLAQVQCNINLLNFTL